MICLFHALVFKPPLLKLMIPFDDFNQRNECQSPYLATFLIIT